MAGAGQDRFHAFPEILVLGAESDVHAIGIATALGLRRARVLLVDFAAFPAVLALELTDGAPRYRGRDLRRAGAVYVRSIHMRLPFFDVEVEGREGATPAEQAALFRRDYAAERERQSFLASFVLALERAGLAVVNPTATLDQHFAKLDQLAILREAGLPVPRTLGTNDPGAVRDFVSEVGGRAVFKPLAGGAACRRVTAADLEDERLHALGRAPVLFQEEAPGTNVRVFVVGGRAVATYEIESDELDFRGHEKALRLLDPAPPAVVDAGVRAARACGMAFSGVDIRLAPDGSFRVLEANPSPMFHGFEQWTGSTPVTNALCEYLIAEARRIRSSRGRGA